MNDRQWQRARALFDTAAELPAAERERHLAEACADDPDLHQKVIALLAQDDEGDAPLLDAVARVAADVGAESDPDLDQMIGPYRLVREIAHGGMGTVYLAQRDDEHFQQAVAIKLIRGWAHDELIRRFRVERQILANLDHPHIGRLLDGGATASGLPYLVMEYVDGRPIGTYCDAERLPIPDRIRLMGTLCRAVHYAHERGVVHRDLKPSNVLVTSDGVPKLLDFGIARLLDTSADGGSAVQTIQGASLMTPEYASPEQALGAPVTTASDVYVLGLLLYELLTGVRPQRPRTNRQEEIVRVVAETTPPRPSEAVRRARASNEAADTGTPGSPPESLADTCAARKTTADRLARTLDGDLDRIVLKAISKEPGRRYSSAASLADDLQRYLDGDPIHARSDSLGYVMRRRLSQRWRLAATVAAVAVLFGAQGTWWLAHRAEARAAAEAAQRFGRQVERLGLDLRIERGLPLHDTRPAKARVRQRIVDIRRQMVEVGQPATGPGHYAIGLGYLALGENESARDELTEAWNADYRLPEVSTNLGLALGRLYREALLEIGSVGNPALRDRRRTSAQASLRDPAVRFLRMGDADADYAVYAASLIDFFEGRLDEAAVKAGAARAEIGWLHETLLLEGDVALDRAVAHVGTGKTVEARQMIAQASALYEEAVGMAASDPVPYSRLCALGAIRVGLELDAGGQLAAMVESAAEACRKASVADPDLVKPYVDLARTYWNFGTYQRRSGGDPLPSLARAIESAGLAIVVDPRDARAYLHLGTGLQQRGAHELESGKDPRASLDAAIRAYGQASERGLDDASLHNSLANAYAYRGDWEQSAGLDPLKTYAAAVAEYRTAGERDPQNALPYGNMGITFKDMALLETGRGRDPLPLLRDSIAAYETALERNPRHAPTLNNTAQSWYRVGVYQFSHGHDPTKALDEADGYVARAIAANASYATPYVNRGEVALLRARFVLATGGDPRSVLQYGRAALARAREINPRNRASFYAHAARVEVLEARWQLTQGGEVAGLLGAARRFAAQMQQISARATDAWDLQAQAGLIEAQWRMSRGLSPDAALAAAGTAIGKALGPNPDAPWYVETALEIRLRRAEAPPSSPARAAPNIAAGRALAPVAQARHAPAVRIKALEGALASVVARRSGDAAQAAQGVSAIRSAIAANAYLTREFQSYLPR